MRSTTNLLIINLAAADLLFVIFCVPFTATDYILPEWPFGLMWCKFVSTELSLALDSFAAHCPFCFHIGTIYDSGYCPCQRVHLSSYVLGSVSCCGPSNHQYVDKNREKCCDVRSLMSLSFFHCTQLVQSSGNYFLLQSNNRGLVHHCDHSNSSRRISRSAALS